VKAARIATEETSEGPATEPEDKRGSLVEEAGGFGNFSLVGNLNAPNLQQPAKSF
jgi:hypothetical protein